MRHARTQLPGTCFGRRLARSRNPHMFPFLRHLLGLLLIVFLSSLLSISFVFFFTIPSQPDVFGGYHGLRGPVKKASKKQANKQNCIRRHELREIRFHFAVTSHKRTRAPTTKRRRMFRRRFASHRRRK